MSTHRPAVTVAPAPAGFDAAAFVAHLDHQAEVSGCDYCETAPMLTDLHRVWTGETTTTARGETNAFALMWSMQDAYGEPGAMPGQGYDWSGVRDSTPATVRAMWYRIYGTEG